jgi:hypothetical protein
MLNLVNHLPMKNLIPVAALTCSFLLNSLVVSAQTAADVSKPAFENRWNGAADAQQFAKACVSSLSDASYQEMLRESRKGVNRSSQPSSGASYLLFSIDGVFCIPKSVAGFPILPVETLKSAFSVDGASSELMNSFYQSIAQDISEKGVAEAIVISPTGTAVKALFKVNETQPTEFFITHTVLKSDNYDKTSFKNILLADFRTIKTNADGAGGRRSLASGIFVDRPLIEQNFLSTVGNAATQAFLFENTLWKFTDNSSVIELHTNGKATMKPQHGKQTEASWKVQDGLVLINYGRVFLSGTVENDDVLVLSARLPGSSRTDMTSMNPGQLERRWNLKLRRG